MAKASEKLSYISILFRLVPVCWILAAAWPYGGATWLSQFWLNIAAAIALAYCVGVILVTGGKLRGSSQATLFLITLMLMSGWSALQTISWDPTSTIGSKLQSVSLQSNFLAPNSGTEIVEGASSESPSHPSISQVAISVDRGHTLAALPNLSAALVAFSIGYFLIGTSPRLALVAFALLLANCSIIAGIGIAEDIASNKWQLLDIKLPTAFGPFVSRNSAAMFLNIGIASGFGALACLPKSKSNKDADPSYRYSTKAPLAKITTWLEDLAADISSSKIAVGAAMVLVSVGILVTLSRGGMASSIAGFALVASASLFRTRRIESIALIGILFATSIGLIIWLDQLELVTSRIETITEGNAVASDSRWTIWRFASFAFSDLWSTGGGLGNFHYTYLPFQTTPLRTWFYHAESFYWQTAVDLGLPGVAAIAFGALLLIATTYRILKKSESQDTHAMGPVIVFLLSSLSLHCSVDFSLILPGIFLPACFIIGILFAMSEAEQSKRRRSKRKSSKPMVEAPTSNRPKHTIFPALILLVAGGTLAASPRWVSPRSVAERLQASLDQWQHDGEDAEATLEKILADGERALELNPFDGQLNLILGEAYTEKFRWLQYHSLPKSPVAWNNTNIVLTRIEYFERLKTEQVNLAEFFTNEDQLTCLKRAQTYWRIAHQALPLDWRPHVALAELDFVDFEHEQTQFHLNKLKSLAFSRPKVLTNAAVLALAYPGKDLAFELFKRSLESSPSQLQVIFPIAYQQFGSRLVNEPFLPKDPIALLQLAQEKNSARLDPIVIAGIWNQIEESLPNLPENNRQKPVIAATVYRQLGNRPQEIASLKQAVTMSPIDTDLRLRYATTLFEDKQFKVAFEQIETCLRQRPKDPKLEELKSMIEQELTQTLSP